MTQIYDELSNFFPISLVELAKKLDYDKDNLLVLESDEKNLETMYPKTYENILSCIHNRDIRTPMQYARDLVASWLFEDYLVYKFNELGYSLLLKGKDSTRKILSNLNVGAESDALFTYSGKEVNIEIINDYTGFWFKNKKMHLRDAKFIKLRNEKSILLAISIKDRSFIVMPITENTGYKYINSHFPYGGKPAYEIKISNKFLDFNVKEIIKNIIDIIDNKK